MAKKTKANGKAKHIEKHEVVRKFWVPLTGKEKDALALEAGNTDSRVQANEEKFADIRKEWKAKIDTDKTRVREILRTLKTGKEFRELEVLEVKDFTACTVKYLHGKKVLETRPMNDDDKQTSMRFKQKKADEENERVAKKLQAEANEHKAGKTRKIKTKLNDDVAEVVKLETKKGTKKSAVDPVHPEPA